MFEQVYNDDFYKNRNRDTYYAAETILNLVLKRLLITPKSIVDIGCGVGTWLQVANIKYNINTVVGVDGDYVPRRYLQIKENEFVTCNLENYSVDKVMKENRKFDIAISLEVAEHISEENAFNFINKLCKLSDVVVFSAAVPKQGGILM